jgi:sigma-B regulation protein RsbU (phosphoserine phosphatase)
MNVNLCEGNVDCMFVTLFVGVFNLQTGHLHYCNAGHMPPIVINKKPEPLSVNQIAPVGLVEDTPYLTEEVVIEPQTTILLYTDGLNEAMDANGKQFGEDRILDEMSHAIQDSQLSPKAVIDRMTQSVHLFVGDTEQSDDLTMLAFRFIK